MNRDDRVMDVLEYSDDGDWPAGPDGGGVTLAKREQNSADSRPANWVGSSQLNGTPGRTNFTAAGALPTVITQIGLESEWKYRADPSPPPPDWNADAYDDDAWPSGPAVLHAGSAQLAGTGEGLVAYWPLNETTGPTAPNAVAGAPDGTLNGTVSWLNDPTRGPCLNFTGAAGAHVNAGLTTIPQMTLTNSFTWAFWARTTQAANSNVIIGNRYSPTAGIEWSPREFIKFTTSQFEFHRNAVGQNIDYPDIPLNTWIHHAVVKEGAALTYYRNGVAFGSATISEGLNNPQPLFFGGDRSQENWAGRLDDVALWNRAFTPVAIALLASGGTTPLNAGAPATLRTAVPSGSTTFYFRQEFSFNGNPARTSLTLRLLADDGAVVYLNGAEVHRANMPGGVVAHGTLASSEVTNAATRSGDHAAGIGTPSRTEPRRHRGPPGRGERRSGHGVRRLAGFNRAARTAAVVRSADRAERNLRRHRRQFPRRTRQPQRLVDRSRKLDTLLVVGCRVHVAGTLPAAWRLPRPQCRHARIHTSRRR